jgi:hypothetical protein
MDKKQIELIAPCGLFCGICASYLAYSRNIPKKKNQVSHCPGCRPRNKQCAYLKKNCSSLLEGKVLFCYQCEQYPCERLLHLDQRYRLNYKHSPIDNLEEIRSEGTAAFLANIQNRYKCGECGGTISLHNQVCYDCQQSELRGSTNNRNWSELSRLK